MLAAEVLAWLPERSRAECVLRMSQSWIERNFESLPIKINDIFYQRTWSLKFLDRVLRPEATELWDHISAWYVLTDAFCERNIDWLNFHDLVYSQDLSREFYIRHVDRIDWIVNPVDRNNLYEELYKK